MTVDRFGRKVAIYGGSVLFIIGAILQAPAFTVSQMTVGRLVVGLGVGSAAMIFPVSTRFQGPTLSPDQKLALYCGSCSGKV